MRHQSITMNHPSLRKVKKKKLSANTSSKFSNADIINIRILYQKQLKSMHEIHAMYPNMSEGYLRKVLNYTVRSGVECDVW